MTAEQMAQPHGIAIPAGALDLIRRPDVSDTAPVTTAPDVSEPGSEAVGVGRSGSLRGAFADLAGADHLPVDDLTGDELDEARELLSALAALLPPVPVESSGIEPPGEVADVSEPGPAQPSPAPQPSEKEPVVATSETPAQSNRVHFVGSVVLHLPSTSVFGDSRSYGYGDEVDVTPEILRANDDRNGESWFRTWFESGEPTCWRGDAEVVRRGPWPTDQCRFEPGSWAWSDARREAMAPTYSMGDPAERAAARAEVDRFFGVHDGSNRNMMTVTPR